MRVAVMLLGLLVATPVVAPLGGCMVLQDFEGAREKAYAASVRANMYAVGLAIEQYNIDNVGTYPANEGWLAAVTNFNYLPDDQMPQNPYLRENGQRSRQANDVGVAGTPLAPATAKKPSPEGTVVGPGRLPDGKAYDARTYGAIVYDHDPASGSYVLYAIGRRGADAVVVGSFPRPDEAKE